MATLWVLAASGNKLVWIIRNSYGSTSKCHRQSLDVLPNLSAVFGLLIKWYPGKQLCFAFSARCDEQLLQSG